MENIIETKKEKKKKEYKKELHIQCDMALYKEFEDYCHRNKKDVSKAIRSYMKICVGELE